MFSHYSIAEPFTFPRALSSRNSRIPRWYRLLVKSESNGRLRRMLSGSREGSPVVVASRWTQTKLARTNDHGQNVHNGSTNMNERNELLSLISIRNEIWFIDIKSRSNLQRHPRSMKFVYLYWFIFFTLIGSLYTQCDRRWSPRERKRKRKR